MIFIKNTNMTLNILISCMHQKDASIIKRSNVQSDVVVVNQCDHDSIEEYDFINKKGRTCHAKFICTTERGLSKSRNMAIRNAWGDICQICDDDEVLPDDGEEKILKAYAENPNAGLIAFAVVRNDRPIKYPQEKRPLGFIQILKTSSIQITFSRHLSNKHGILFDEKMGSGTGNGGGEENRFMLDWRKKRVKMLYYLVIIATLMSADSQWFHGYDARYFENLGWTDRRILGNVLGMIYLFYWPLFRRKSYKQEGSLSLLETIKYSLKGYFSKR